MIIIIGILAAIAIPMFLNQRDKAKDAGVKEGVHTHPDRRPELRRRQQRHLSWDTADLEATLNPDYVDNWPDDPWGDGTVLMATNTATQGNADYTVTDTNSTGDPTEFQLVGYGKDDDPIITVP